MVKVAIDCIDAGTDYCPCKLAEYDQCLICSQCQEKVFCDCLNWKGVCIYQEFYDNNKKAKEGRKTYECIINNVTKYNRDLIMIKFEAPHKLALDLVKPGSYIFIRTDDNEYFDIPISIMNSDIENDVITIAIEIRGIKTRKLLELKSGENIVIRGPYWNGIFGIKEVFAQKKSKALILARGIGLAPMVPIIRKLISQDNDLKVFVDTNPFNINFAQEFLDEYEIKTLGNSSLLDKGKLSDYAKVIIQDALKDGVNYIHVGGADILTYNVINYLDEINRKDVSLSCCNNFKMCCGEGICGACTARFSGHRVKRFCKEQTDPRSIFEGRRFM